MSTTAVTTNLNTIDSIIRALPSSNVKPLPRPEYTGSNTVGVNLGLAVATMKVHTSDEGWEIFKGLQDTGYTLYGSGLANDLTDITQILTHLHPTTVLMQDKREWDLSGPRDFRDPSSRFTNYYRLGLEPNIFKLTILKDAHQRPEYHRQFMEEIGCHAVVCYYHPKIVQHLAPYTSNLPLIRTYHTINPEYIPAFNPTNNRKGALLSGAISNAYPLRQMLSRNLSSLVLTTHLSHPGYHRRGCHTPQYLQILNQHRIAICTCSNYGYALRKLVEATAAGCIVLTNLPIDDVMPEIDENLVRIPNNITIPELNNIIRDLYSHYNEERQRDFARRAIFRYSYQVECKRLADTIEDVRSSYVTDTILYERGTVS